MYTMNRVLHSSSVDHVYDESVRLLKVLNIEKHGLARVGLNHFDRVSGRNPIEFLEDLFPLPGLQERDLKLSRTDRLKRGHGIAGTNERSIPDLSQTFLSAVNSRMEADLIPEMADLRDLSDPLFALARRMDSYKMCWRCIRPATSNLSTSALARQDELFVQSTSEITELVANLRLRLASPEFLASPGGGEQVAREACLETSAQIRRSLWTLEGRLYRRLCSMFNLRHVAWLARVPDLARAFEAVATLLPVKLCESTYAA